MKSNTIVTRMKNGEEKKYHFEIIYTYGSALFYPYVNGYYLICCPCTVTTDENGKETIDKKKEFEARTPLLEITEPDDKFLVVAEEVAENFIDSSIMQVEQNITDSTREEEDNRKKIQQAMKDALESIKEKQSQTPETPLFDSPRFNKDDFSNSGIEKCKYYTKPSDVTFDDIAGMKEVKREVIEAIDLFRDKEKFAEMGVSTKMNNILLSGSPGSGKTLIVKAMSNELGVPVFSSSGEFAEKYVGMAVKNIKTLFDEARKYAPSIIFIDEAEQVARARTGDSNNSERESGTAELLNQLDGFTTTDDVMVVLATNLPDTMDEAVRRRMTKKIHITNPDYETRLGILEINARNKKMDDSCDLTKIARNLSGFNGGTIANIMNQAGIFAVRKGLDKITQIELEEALERETCGLKSETKKLGEKEKEIVSYHEIGHAVTSFLLKSEKIQKISILPTTGDTLGYVFYANEDEEDKFLKTKDEFLNDIVVSLAGRASEELTFGNVTGGCANDLQKATRVAERMITEFGMYEEFGLMSIDAKDSFLREKVHGKVNEILNECYAEAKRILTEYKLLVDKLAEELISKEEMTLADFDSVFKKVESQTTK